MQRDTKKGPYGDCYLIGRNCRYTDEVKMRPVSTFDQPTNVSGRDSPVNRSVVVIQRVAPWVN